MSDDSNPIRPALITPPLPFPFDRGFPIIPPRPPPPHFFLHSFQHPCLFYHHNPGVRAYTTQESDEPRFLDIPSAAYTEQGKGSATELIREEDVEEEEDDVFVMTDEWVKFFAESDAKRRAEKKKQKKLRKGSNSSK